MADEFKIVKLLDGISLNITNDSILDNVSASAAPTVTDDTNAGYSVRSIWIDTTNDEAYIAVDVTAGAAVWRSVSSLEELNAHIADVANPHTVTFTQAVAVDGGTDISAAEAETLTDGSNADALHAHDHDSLTNFVAGEHTDAQVKVSSNDTTPGYLEDKIVSADTKLTVSTLNDGLDEDVQLAVNEGNIDHDALLNFAANEHFTEASIDHTAIQNIGTNTHAQLDTHVADSTIHFTEGSIDHTAITNIGTNSHAQIDTHIADTSNPHSVTKAQVGLTNVQDILSKFDATTAPIATDDSGSGYAVGSKWVDVTNDKVYQCVDATSTAAVWIETSADNDTTDHTLLSNIGTNTHAQIDTHIADSTIHFTEGSIDHGSIAGLVDDDHTQYHNDTRGDARYYQKTEFITTSAGAGDAGKPIELDAAGHVDATMINDADIDHTNIGSVGTNTHAQIDTHIADSTIHFTEGSIDHGSIAGLADDDHTQYILVDGTRAFTGAQTIANATGALNSGAYTFDIQSSVADGASAVGFTIDNANALITSGAKNIVLSDASTEYLSISTADNVTKFTDQSLWMDGTTGSTPTSGIGTRMMWIPDKAAFRAGNVGALDSTAWDDANIGSSTAAFGATNKVSGNFSAAFGQNNEVTGQSCLVGGSGNEVTANTNAVFGSSQTVSGLSNLVAGSGNIVSGGTNMVSGSGCTVASSGNIVGGFFCQVTGGATNYNILGGVLNTISSGTVSMVGGQLNSVAASISFVHGVSNSVSGGVHGRIAIIGSNSLVDNVAAITDSVAIGEFIHLDHSDSLVIGRGASAGSRLVTTASDQILMGMGSTTGDFRIDAEGSYFLSAVHCVTETITGATTLDETHNMVICNSASAFTVTLPAAAGVVTGRVYNIKNKNTGVVTVDGNASETIDGSTTQTLNQYENIQIVSDGTEWWIL